MEGAAVAMSVVVLAVSRQPPNVRSRNDVTLTRSIVHFKQPLSGQPARPCLYRRAQAPTTTRRHLYYSYRRDPDATHERVHISCHSMDHSMNHHRNLSPFNLWRFVFSDRNIQES